MGERHELEPGSDGATLSRAERDVLDGAARALAASDGGHAGLDAEALDRVATLLHKAVPFDRVTVHVEDEGHATVWIFWSRTFDGSPIGAYAPGTRIERGARQRARATARRERRAGEIIEDTATDPLASERARAAGVRSFVLVPIVHEGLELGGLSLAHAVRGAPSQGSLPLLTILAGMLGPPLARALERRRALLFASLVEGSPDGMLALDREGHVVEANRASLRMLDRSRAEVIGRPVVDVLGPETSAALTSPWTEGTPKTLELDHDALRAKVAFDAVVSRVDTQGEVHFQVHLRDARARRAVEDATARRVQHFGFLRGLSESMAGDLRVQTALERAATFCAARSDVGGVMMFRAEGPEQLRLVVARGVNERTADRLAHVTVKDLEAMLDTRGTDVKRVHGVVEAVGAAIDPETTGLVPRWKILVPLAHARRPLGAMLVLGKPGAMLTETERELWESVAGTVSAALHAAEDFEHVVSLEAEKRQLVDSLPVIVVRIDPKTGATLFVNGAVTRILGFLAADVLGHPGMDGLLADPIEWEASAVARDRAARGKDAVWQDRRYRHKDGRLVTLRESVHPVRDASGAVRAIEVIAYDVSDELESRKQLMQADRLASLGALAGGIAHEINNPVAFIGLAASQLLKMVDLREGDPRRADTAERAKDLLLEIGEASARIANIVGELKLFTRIPEGAHVTPVDVNRIVQMAVTLTSAELRRRARLEINLGELPIVPGEYASLGQAFVNLLLNAAEAIDAKSDGSSASFVRVSTFVEGGAIVVRVADTGVGIEPRILPRIFDPFFKTKDAGEGAGLGLAIAHNLVRRVGGDIRVTSELGEGSTFDVVLPLDPVIDAAAPARGIAQSGHMKAASIAPAPVAGEPRGRVLIVDDEQSLAKALARQLSTRWDVDTVSTARDALAELAVHRYDVVVCDLRMPDQSGPAIHDATKARSPKQAARFIFTTGGSYGTADDEIHQRAEATGRPILEKPFDGASFEALVDKVASEKDAP